MDYGTVMLLEDKPNLKVMSTLLPSRDSAGAAWVQTCNQSAGLPRSSGPLLTPARQTVNIHVVYSQS